MVAVVVVVVVDLAKRRHPDGAMVAAVVNVEGGPDHDDATWRLDEVGSLAEAGKRVGDVLAAKGVAVVMTHYAM